MSAGQATYSARAFNSDMGSQDIPGRLTVLPEAVLFESNDANCGIPLARLQLERDLSTRILFTDPEQPEWRISTDEEAVLQAPAIQRHYRARMQARQLRQLDDEADRLGFQYLVWANIDPRGGAEFFQKIRGNPRREKLEEAVPLIFRSHPPTLASKVPLVLAPRMVPATMC